MKRELLAAVHLLLAGLSAAQWTWTPIAPLPLPTANAAVCAAEVNGAEYVYVFGGITTGLEPANIHRSAFRYDVQADAWSALPDIPDTLGKIAAAASVVGDTAYVIGGYHVFNGAPFELSSNKVHRLNLVTNTWMSDGAPVPVPIDDQVQAVWHDSLIHVITGWSNTTNVANVQVYDPAHNSWSAGTPVPNNNQFKAFGASGVIVGDTIHYHGGASTGGNFPAQDRVRVGRIDPADPLNITWLPAITGGQGARYRSGAIALNGVPTWIGGSAVSYNYDALAYNGSGIVEPVTDVLQWNGTDLSIINQTPTQVMDLRGLGDLGDGRFVVAGGIGTQRTVLDSAWLVTWSATGVAERPAPTIQVYPNPTSGIALVTVPSDLLPAQRTLFDAWGRQLLSTRIAQERSELDLSGLPPGWYYLRVTGTSEAFGLPLLKGSVP